MGHNAGDIFFYYVTFYDFTNSNKTMIKLELNVKMKVALTPAVTSTQPPNTNTWRRAHFHSRKKSICVFNLIYSVFSLFLTGLVLASADHWGYGQEQPNGVIAGKSISIVQSFCYNLTISGYLTT